MRDFYDRSEVLATYSREAAARVHSGPAQDMPLALCDTRTVEAPDKQYCSITMQNSLGDGVIWENVAVTSIVRGTQWWYCRDMRRDEALVFRSFGSDPGGRGAGAPQRLPRHHLSARRAAAREHRSPLQPVSRRPSASIAAGRGAAWTGEDTARRPDPATRTATGTWGAASQPPSWPSQKRWSGAQLSHRPSAFQAGDMPSWRDL